jgi:Protein of unknown function (DUF3630)
MQTYPLESLAKTKMASGHLCLNLTAKVSWEAFPAFADWFILTVGGKVIQQTDAPDMRLWDVEIDFRPLRLVFDDYPLMVSLESSDEAGDSIVEEVHKKLRQN